MNLANPFRDNWNIPVDAKVVRTVGAWDIYHSQSRKAMYIYPADYHPPSLKLEPEELRALLQMLESGPDTGASKVGFGNNLHPVS